MNTFRLVPSAVISFAPSKSSKFVLIVLSVSASLFAHLIGFQPQNILNLFLFFHQFEPRSFVRLFLKLCKFALNFQLISKCFFLQLSVFQPQNIQNLVLFSYHLSVLTCAVIFLVSGKCSKFVVIYLAIAASFFVQLFTF